MTKINMNEANFKILFVCMGNICRSPTAPSTRLGMFSTPSLVLLIYGGVMLLALTSRW
jgi:hypothetical protein